MQYWQDQKTLQKGKYTILGDPLGVGGFGVTYLAKNHESGATFALKTLNIMIQDKG
jgi:eukaryotic-like serine/threonine-protein kinase